MHDLLVERPDDLVELAAGAAHVLDLGLEELVALAAAPTSSSRARGLTGPMAASSPSSCSMRVDGSVSSGSSGAGAAMASSGVQASSRRSVSTTDSRRIVGLDQVDLGLLQPAPDRGQLVLARPPAAGAAPRGVPRRPAPPRAGAGAGPAARPGPPQADLGRAHHPSSRSTAVASASSRSGGVRPPGGAPRRARSVGAPPPGGARSRTRRRSTSPAERTSHSLRCRAASAMRSSIRRRSCRAATARSAASHPARPRGPGSSSRSSADRAASRAMRSSSSARLLAQLLELGGHAPSGRPPPAGGRPGRSGGPPRCGRRPGPPRPRPAGWPRPLRGRRALLGGTSVEVATRPDSARALASSTTAAVTTPAGGPHPPAGGGEPVAVPGHHHQIGSGQGQVDGLRPTPQGTARPRPAAVSSTAPSPREVPGAPALGTDVVRGRTRLPGRDLVGAGPAGTGIGQGQHGPGGAALAQPGQRGLGRLAARDHHGGHRGTGGRLEGVLPPRIDLHHVEQGADHAVHPGQQLGPGRPPRLVEGPLEGVGPGRRAVELLFRLAERLLGRLQTADRGRAWAASVSATAACSSLAGLLRSRPGARPARGPRPRGGRPAARRWPSGRPAGPVTAGRARGRAPASRAGRGPPSPPLRPGAARSPSPPRLEMAPRARRRARGLAHGHLVVLGGQRGRLGFGASSSSASRAPSASRVETTSASAAASRAWASDRCRSRSTPARPAGPLDHALRPGRGRRPGPPRAGPTSRRPSARCPRRARRASP